MKNDKRKRNVPTLRSSEPRLAPWTIKNNDMIAFETHPRPLSATAWRGA